jgi:hypothetical protein
MESNKISKISDVRGKMGLHPGFDIFADFFFAHGFGGAQMMLEAAGLLGNNYGVAVHQYSIGACVYQHDTSSMFFRCPGWSQVILQQHFFYNRVNKLFRRQRVL